MEQSDGRVRDGVGARPSDPRFTIRIGLPICMETVGAEESSVNHQRKTTPTRTARQSADELVPGSARRRSR
jgi:hypothetical protein